jgi:transcriptional regulator with XRE-family HTH domain
MRRSAHLNYDARPMAGHATKQQEADLDLGRRVAAARAYRRKTQTDLADMLGVRRQTVADYEEGKIGAEVKREGIIAKTCELTDLPREFFAIDFNDLPVMVKAWRQVADYPDQDALQKLLADRPRQAPPSE